MAPGMAEQRELSLLKNALGIAAVLAAVFTSSPSSVSAQDLVPPRVGVVHNGPQLRTIDSVLVLPPRWSSDTFATEEQSDLLYNQLLEVARSYLPMQVYPDGLKAEAFQHTVRDFSLDWALQTALRKGLEGVLLTDIRPSGEPVPPDSPAALEFIVELRSVADGSVVWKSAAPLALVAVKEESTFSSLFGGSSSEKHVTTFELTNAPFVEIGRAHGSQSY